MKMNMHIVTEVLVIAAFAPCAHAAGAPCTVPALGWKITGGAKNDNTSTPCVAGTSLIDNAECWLMAEVGYTSNSDTATATSYKCTSSALNTDMNLEVTGCAANFYQASDEESEFMCAACSPGTGIAAMPVQSNATTCAVTTTISTTTTMNNTQMVCPVPSNATNPTMTAAYVECLGTNCEDANAPWMEALSTVPMVTCTKIVAAVQNNCSMPVGSALSLLMTDMNKSLDADTAQAVEMFTVKSVCCSACSSDGAALPDGTASGATSGSALVDAAPATSPSIPFLMLVPTALLLSISF